MRMLVLGGTVFLGRHLVGSAVAAGHEVTLFNRGRHNADLFPDVEKLRGDRDSDVSSLAGRRFDSVIDTSAYTVPQVTRVLDVLRGAVGHYTFVSGISAYADFAVDRLPEEAAVQELPEIPAGDELHPAYAAIHHLVRSFGSGREANEVARLQRVLAVGRAQNERAVHDEKPPWCRNPGCRNIIKPPELNHWATSSLPSGLSTLKMLTDCMATSTSRERASGSDASRG
jgi:hypothetical protein